MKELTAKELLYVVGGTCDCYCMGASTRWHLGTTSSYAICSKQCERLGSSIRSCN